MKTAVEKYRGACEELVEAFIDKYFTYDDGSREDDYYFIGAWRSLDTIGIGDYFFHLSDIEQCLNFDIPEDILFGWWDYSLDQYYLPKEEQKIYNLYSYRRLKTVGPAIIEEERQIDIKKAEKRVEKARKLLEEAIKANKDHS